MQHTESAIAGTNLHRVCVTDDSELMRAAQNARGANGMFVELPEGGEVASLLEALLWSGAVVLLGIAAMAAIVLMLLRIAP